MQSRKDLNQMLSDVNTPPKLNRKQRRKQKKRMLELEIDRQKREKAKKLRELGDK